MVRWHLSPMTECLGRACACVFAAMPFVSELGHGDRNRSHTIDECSSAAALARRVSRDICR